MSPQIHVTHLRRVVLGSPRPERLADFYEQVWGLRKVAALGDTLYLRGTGSEHHILVIRPCAQPAVLGYSLGLESRDAVERAARELSARRGIVVRSPAGPIVEPGGGYGFQVSDVDGRTIEFSAEVEVAPPAPAGAGPGTEPVKISHLVLNSPQAKELTELFIEVFGFRLADEMPHMLFLRCNTDHHSIAIVPAPHASLNHVAFEVPTVDDMLKGVDALSEQGFEVLWGPGRHGPGDNAFGYFAAPNGQVIEYTAEVQQVYDEDDVSPRMWLPEEMRVHDAWADPDSARPTPETRKLMLGEPEPAEAEPSVVGAAGGGGATGGGGGGGGAGGATGGEE